MVFGERLNSLLAGFPIFETQHIVISTLESEYVVIRKSFRSHFAWFCARRRLQPEVHTAALRRASAQCHPLPVDGRCWSPPSESRDRFPAPASPDRSSCSVAYLPAHSSCAYGRPRSWNGNSTDASASAPDNRIAPH